jgi:hypothetical protein
MGFNHEAGSYMSSIRIVRLVVAAICVIAFAATASAVGPESKQLSRAKDLIADEQWLRAIEVLRTAIADPNETRRDEALYWLAHSQHQSGDSTAAVETISRLERDFPSSMWVKPARSLRIEIAVRLNRSDVLWWTAAAKPQIYVDAPKPVTKPAPKATARPSGGNSVPPDKVAPGEIPIAVDPPVIPPPPKVWWDPETKNFDVDLQVLALNGLMKTDAPKVIPLLSEIAVKTEDANLAGRVLFMLAQSDSPEARATVLRVAKTGPEPARVAAVRVWGRFGGPDVPKQLLEVYPTAVTPVKLQIVKSLGERSEKGALAQIVASEKEAQLRYTAIACLAQAGGADQLALMYKTFGVQARKSVIAGLSSVRADAELVRIAETESDAALQAAILERLRVLGTPKAKEYLQKVSEKR